MKKYAILFLILPLLLLSCVKEPELEPDTYEGNFRTLWKIIDTQYCYLDFKEIDWDAIYYRYYSRLPVITNESEFFNLLGDMLSELKDGHVNLYSPFDMSRYWAWYTAYPPNFNSDIIYSDRYLGKDYKIAGGIRYNKIDGGRVGYIYYGSFGNGFSGMNYIFDYFSDCQSLIIDVRDNGGGSLNYSEALASYFFDQDTKTGYISHKTGPGHSDFSKPVALMTKAQTDLRWEKPVAVLTNRMSYSATNDFVNRMKSAPRAIVVGDKTGGGGGMPLSSELPNGWMVRFSACPMFDVEMKHTEWGIDPDYKVDLDTNDRASDAIIEEAIRLMK